MEFEAGHVIGGKYRLFKLLARGGMGAIWVARHTELDVSVAVKLVGSDLVLSQNAVARFRQEARAAAQLRSPHVVQILDYGVEDGVPFMVMELLSGTDLDNHLEQKGRLPLARVIEILAPVCKALKLAHGARIVHRDLKPANIFLARVGEDEVVKVLDFGIAKALNPEANHAQTGSSTLIGSPPYMSPEQSRGDPVDARADLWSLAVVAFQALTGDVPFRGRGLGDIFGQICQGETPLPSARGVEIPGLDELFQKALAKDREQRFASAAELIAALEQCASGDAEPARRIVARDTDTIDAPIDRATPPAGRTEQGSGTNAAISAEVARGSSVGATAAARSWPARLGWRIAAPLGGALAVVAWQLGAFDRSPANEDVTPSAERSEASATSTATTTAGGAQVSLASESFAAGAASSAGGEPAASGLAAGSASVSAVASAAVQSAAAAGKQRPPPAAAIKTGSSAVVKPSATTDPIFGISPDKK